MLRFFKELAAQKKADQNLLDLYYEVAQNWENWHVMHQRNVLDKFKLEANAPVRTDVRINANLKFGEYVKKFTEYNHSMDEFRIFEQWYISDIKNKTTENARVLHSKRETAAAKFKGLLAVVEPLKKELGEKLRAEGILKEERRVD